MKTWDSSLPDEEEDTNDDSEKDCSDVAEPKLYKAAFKKHDMFRNINHCISHPILSDSR